MALLVFRKFFELFGPFSSPVWGEENPGCDAQIDFSIFAHRPRKNALFRKNLKKVEKIFFRKKSGNFVLKSRKKWPQTRCKKPISKFFFGTHFFSKIEKSKIWNPKITEVVWVGLSSKIQKVVKMGSFLRSGRLVEIFCVKNSPDFSLSNASIFGSIWIDLGELWHFLFFRKFFENPKNKNGHNSP